MNTTTKQTLTAGAGYGAPIFISDLNASMTAIPGSGGSMTVQYSTSTQADINAGVATWTVWQLGTVTTTTTDGVLGRITAVRASATTADGTFEVCQ